MYHALVRINGMWCSFGIHSPSQDWSDFLNFLRKSYGATNVACLYWHHDDNLGSVYDARKRVAKDCAYANEVQEKWDKGEMPEAEGDGRLNLAYGIRLMYEAAVGA